VKNDTADLGKFSLALVSIAVGGAVLYSRIGNVIRGNIVNIPTYDVWNVVKSAGTNSTTQRYFEVMSDRWNAYKIGT
jgi:hypothetical protein